MKISVIMPSYNQADFVAAAIESVLGQEHTDKELIFIDGGSTDGTMDIVESYRERMTFCVSEPDRGQSDALRKGFAHATGEVFTWLSTDDLLLPGALAEVDRLMSGSSGCDWVLGNVIWIDAEDCVVRCWRAGGGDTAGLARLGVLTAGGPSAFFRRDLYERVGGVDLDFHYAMDTDLWWRFAMSGASSRRMSSYAWALRLHADAKVSGHLFYDLADLKQREVVERRAVEASRIRERTACFIWPLPRPLPRLLGAARRLMSVSYIRGQYENRVWKGMNLWDVVSAS